MAVISHFYSPPPQKNTQVNLYLVGVTLKIRRAERIIVLKRSNLSVFLEKPESKKG
jgi:hypothetical protein